MNTEYGINIAIDGRPLFTVELPPRANEQQAEAIARRFVRRFPKRDGYRFAVEPLPKPQDVKARGAREMKDPVLQATVEGPRSATL